MKGVIYQLSGIKSAGPLAVSLYTLRKHYSGPVTILYTPGCLHEAKPIAGVFGCDCRCVLPKHGDSSCKNRHFSLKPITYAASPYSQSIFLDADTIIQKPIDDLFAYNWGATQVGGCHLDDESGRAHFARKRLEYWRGEGALIDSMIDLAIEKNVPIINTGVFAFWRDHPHLKVWAGIVEQCRNHNTAGELAMALMQPIVPDFCVLPDWYWNHTAYSTGRPEDAAICHYTRKRYLKTGSRWWESFRECKTAAPSPELLAILSSPL